MTEPRKWRNRIVRRGEADPEGFLANPANWRTHPREQEEALEGVLESVGWVQEVVVNLRSGKTWGKAERGRETLVDGHLRVQLAIREGETSIPVTYVDLDPDEERLILATLDPLAGLADADAAALGRLLEGTETDDPAVKALLEDVAIEAGLYSDPAMMGGTGDGETLLDQAVQLEPTAEYVVVACDGPEEWERIREALGLKQVRRGGYKRGSPFDDVGTERVVPAAVLLERLEGRANG